MEDDTLVAWDNLKKNHAIYIESRMNFIKKQDHPQIISAALDIPGERGLSLDLISALPISEGKNFFDKLVALASYVHGFTERCRDLILRLPHDWVMSNIEREIEIILKVYSIEFYKE